MENGLSTTGNSKLDQAVKQWLQYDKNPKTASMVQELVKEGAVEALKKYFSSRMEFGTAGLRAAMGPGTSCMNDLTIIQTTQGFCHYLEKSFDTFKERGVVIGYDARAHPPSGGSSKRFASLAAAVFISRGVPVHLFSDITPTPFVPFTVLHLGLCAGIMVTASHNPKQDNGYKVYWDNGAQIVSPHDKGISQAIEENLEPWPESWSTEEALKSPLLKDPYQDIHTQYFKAIQKHCHHRNLNKSSKVKIVHTSVHGVGHTFVQSAFKAFDLHPPYAVEEQKDPDPEFPTVKYPNPEEGEGVLTLSFALAEREGATVVGQWRVFSGNELGALLGWWMFRCWKNQNCGAAAVKNLYMLSSTVSSKILRAIALKEGFHFEWMGNRARELLDQGKTVLFAFEEAIGYMCSPSVLDKDGVSAAAIAGEMISYLATKSSSLSQQLTAIYEEYGYHISKNSYFICHDQDVTRSLFERLRNYSGQKDSYPTKCGCFSISAVLPTSRSSQMITFTFSNGGVATMRTSGTEPKIKYYTELCAAPGNSNVTHLKKELDDLVDAIVENFFEPEKNKLQPKPEHTRLAKYDSKSRGRQLPLTPPAMEGLYFEVKPRRDGPSRPGSAEKPLPNITLNHRSRPCSSLSHITSSTLCPQKPYSARERNTTLGGKIKEEGEEEIRYKLILIGSLPVHHLTTMAMLPWVVVEISKSRPAEKNLGAGLWSGGQLDPSTCNQTVFLCVSALLVRCVSVLGEGVVWDPLTHTVLFECRPHQVTKLIHNSQEPSSFGCLVRDTKNCACYVFQCQDSTKVCVCVKIR
ncbi:hypothetical protein FQN60_011985 [Etheostoma spectabile]|uniref:Phosphoglucomutase 2 n=1 Tax=Etheostoma spectabile TaxID=54343 RepID=A0A5J5DNN4_9PERO|nr:hypothetical protein FQN60_011985 [Etheostoma spectabile]